MCSCVVTVAATAKDAAKGAVVVVAGMAAEILSEAASAVKNIIGELLSDSNDNSADSICAAAW